MINNNSITSIKGIRVGHYTDDEAKTGCSVVIFDNGAAAEVAALAVQNAVRA